MTGTIDLGKVVQALPGSFLIMLPAAPHTIIEISDALLNTIERSRAEVIGRGLFDAFPETVAASGRGERVQQAIATLIETRLAQALPVQRYDLQAGGGVSAIVKFWRSTLFPVLDAQGQVEAIIERVQDVTDEVAQQDNWHAPESRIESNESGLRVRHDSTGDLAGERLDLAAEAAELGTWECSFPTRQFSLNPACRAHYFMTGEAEPDLDGLLKTLHPDDREKTRRAFDAAVYHHGRYDVEYRVVSLDGRSRWLNAKGRASYHPDGSPARMNGITLDISSYKRVEEALRESEEEARLARVAAEHASLVKDEFLSTLSHELRTPLNTILGWTQVLQRSSTRLSEKAATALATIERSARQQARLIDDLLDASAIMAGKIHLDLQPVRCNDIIAASVAVSAPLAAARNIKIEVVMDEPGMAIEADPTRLQQVLCRLLSNAIKFSSNDGTIVVRQIATNDKVVITVTDNGQGIAPAFLPSLFARFSQADGSITRTHMGLGLGLSIVKSLIELHGGRVSASSQGVAQGASFSVELPALLSDENAHTPVGLSSPARLPERVDHDGAWFADIVVVDDEPDAGAVMREILQNAGATVRLASSATQALQLIREQRPDLLISDIGMPQIDGYQLLRLLRKDEARDLPPLPAIALTAFARPEDKQRAIEAGYLIHLAKPVESADLITAAKLAVRRPNRALDTGR
ncbi:MAG: response regulator [Pseudomonadota bacterium]|nr:response regulator [Pseudomonadota bacterium]